MITNDNLTTGLLLPMKQIILIFVRRISLTIIINRKLPVMISGIN